MTVSITALFGSEISVSPMPPVCETQYSGYAGASGVTGMRLGFRGYTIIVQGKLRTNTGLSYAAARMIMITAINNINAYCSAVEDTWFYGSENHYNTVLDRLTLIPGANGRVYRYNSEGQVYVEFVAILRCLG